VHALKGRSLRAEMRTPLAETVAEPYDGPDGLVARSPGAPTISRRAALGLAGAASASIVVLTAGETVGGRFRDIAWLAPRGRSYGSGPNDFQINKTAAAARIRPTDTGPAWRLQITGPGGRQVLLSRDQLLGLRQVTSLLPIACVEGWSTEQSWTGVAMRDLAEMVGGRHASSVTVESVERGGPYALIVLDRAQAMAPAAMLALKVNGADLSMDHGYPARTIIPAAPGVHNTKWVRRISFDGGAV
jgi:DMSO/TMAO reductase YedYZ molybdopterin-dependent catalytic subunit